MGELVQFNVPKRPISEQHRSAEEGKVLVFTGVRYERIAQKQSPAPKPDKPKHKRV